MKNMPVTGDLMPPKPYVTSLGRRSAPLDLYPSIKLMEAVLREIDWKRWRGWGKPISAEGAKRRGIGIAYSVGWAGFYFQGFMTATVIVNKDGSVHILSGTQDLGTGSNTTLRMIAAESLGISMDDVAISTGDTQIGEYDFFGARASRELCTGGQMILSAIEDAKKKIRELAAQRLEAPEDSIVIRNKAAFVREDPERRIPLSLLLTTSVVGTASGPPGSDFPLDRDKVRQPLIQAAEVEVDTETGEISVTRLINGNFPGQMINPEIVKGQYTGGSVMALGLGLFEDFHYSEKERMYLSDNLMDYRIPRAPDIPEIRNVVIEETVERDPRDGPPYGALGVGELATWSIAAIANAIYNALGVRIRKTPMTAERVLETLRGQEE
jgi:xanthine dehydrogenase molybdenum-binding subunit